jgi:RNA polymerase sigma factor for flagellar operon FliA
MTPEQLFLDHLPLIESLATHGARRCGFTKEETEDFVSTVKLRLLEDDYAVIRKFQERSKFSTYLNITVNRLVLDYRNHVWGKWRNSAEAKRLGAVACRLEVLVARERLPFDVACEILRTNERVTLSLQELADLAGRLPQRDPQRRMHGEDELESRPADTETPEERLLAQEAARRKKEMLALLQRALQDLPDEDRLIALLRVRFPIVDVAKALHLEQKALYGRIQKIFNEVRGKLKGMGISAEEIRKILAFPEHDLDG